MIRYYNKKCECGNIFRINKKDRDKWKTNSMKYNNTSCWLCPICCTQDNALWSKESKISWIKDHFDPEHELTIKAKLIMVAKLL